jgi:hypothetical protein
MAVAIGWTFSQPVAAADSSTDTSSDTALIEQMVSEGKTYHEAIQEMVKLRRQGEL